MNESSIRELSKELEMFLDVEKLKETVRFYSILIAKSFLL